MLGGATQCRRECQRCPAPSTLRRHDCYLQYVFSKGSEWKSPRVLTQEIVLVNEYRIATSPPKLQVRTFFCAWSLNLILSQQWNTLKSWKPSFRLIQKRKEEGVTKAAWQSRMIGFSWLSFFFSFTFVDMRERFKGLQWGVFETLCCSAEGERLSLNWVLCECQLWLCLSLMLLVKGCLFKNALSRTNSSFGLCWLSVDQYFFIISSFFFSLTDFDLGESWTREPRSQRKRANCCSLLSLRGADRQPLSGVWVCYCCWICPLRTQRHNNKHTIQLSTLAVKRCLPDFCMCILWQ